MNNRLKELRQYLQLSQKDFGDKLLLTQNHISSLESGRRALNDRTIKDICSVFGVSEEWLRTGQGEMMVDLVGELDDVDNETKDMLRKILALKDEDKDKIKKIIDAFSES